MAEVVGLLASIAALAHLANKAIKFSKKAKSILHDFKTVREDLCRAIGHVDNSARIINIAKSTMDKYCHSQSASESQVIDYVEDENVSKYWQGESQHIERHMRRLDGRLESLQDRHRFWIFLKWWHSLRNELDDLRIEMQHIQASLTLVLTTIQLEHAMKRGKRDEIEM